MLAISSRAAEHATFVPSVYRTFAEWKVACERLPSNRAILRRPPLKLDSALQAAQIEEVLDAFFKICTNGYLAGAEAWIGAAPARGEFFNTSKLYFRDGIPFQPFAQKLSVTTNAEVFFHGDLHGDIHSLIGYVQRLNEDRYLEDFRLVRPDTYLVFLGDYTDRGWYGAEVLYTLFRLCVANPGRVFLLRGNHEDITIASNYGFFAEARHKYGAGFNLSKVLRAFDFLPAVLYAGAGGDFIQCNHGGMEPGFDPQPLLKSEGALRFQLIGALQQRRFLTSHPAFLKQLDPESQQVAKREFKDFVPKTPSAPATLGLMWNDFSVSREEPQLSFDPGRAFVYGDRATAYLLEAASGPAARVRAVFRAHQHSNQLNPMMRALKASKGVYRHWPRGDASEPSADRAMISNSVWTFNVSPDSIYGVGCNFDFDTFAVLKFAEEFSRWQLTVVNLPMRAP